MATIFPDVEKLLVLSIKSGLQASSAAVASNVTVATVKPSPSTSPYPAKIVIVRSDGGTQKERGITRVERVGVNVYAKTYAQASDLARLVESIVRAASGADIKLVETVLSPTRAAEPSTDTQEQRYMSFSIVTQATDN